jgi:hypothetical protein
MSTEVKVPVLGESITEATLGQWLKKPGEAVAADEPIASLETDKVAIEVPSPVAGIMGAYAVEEGRGPARRPQHLPRRRLSLPLYHNRSRPCRHPSQRHPAKRTTCRYRPPSAVWCLNSGSILRRLKARARMVD